MAKKKKSIDLREKHLCFALNNEEYEVVRFYPANMTVDVILFKDGKKDSQINLPFAHLPKKIKEQNKPKK